MTIAQSTPASRAHLLRVRVATTSLFFICGVGLGIWSAHIPLLKVGLRLGDGELGLVLLAMGVGAVAVMPFTALVVHRFGSAASSSAAALAYSAALALPPLAPNLLLLAASAFLIGLAVGLLDIAMNAHAGLVEQAWGRPIMSSIHAFFSLGGLAGGAAGAGLVWIGIGAPAAMALSAAALVTIAAVASFFLPLPGVEASGEAHALRLPSLAVAGLGLLALCSFVCEGAAMEWSGVFLRDVAGAPLALAAGGYAAFSLAMATGRLFGDRVVGRFGPILTITTSGVAASAALLLLIAAPTPWAAYAALMLSGLALSNVVPIVFSGASRVPGVPPAAALAMIATVGYGGQLLAPPSIGFLSDLFGLRAGFLVLFIGAVVIAFAGASVLNRLAPPRP
ncbi:MFS transporter [Hansschlegelia quercus]|uniref:MFS transporter n=1 Tax=Hansschlegelia quercus TaxID=2528245 RepID=A0A4Q9GGX6_9HYPH|nr:MFS transporter [Hansschlegelia quercus]TBN53262.1 MFS transporter [Hansschlegelia quercus]